MEYGLIGEHLPHSYSKIIHEAIGDYTYELKELAPEELDGFLKKKDFRAVNVTIPYKQDVIPYLDEIDPQAEAIGAVNCIVCRDGRLYGYNTDFFGMQALILRNGIEIQGRNTLIYGSGGTSKTAEAVLKSLGASRIIKASRKGLGIEDIKKLLAEAKQEGFREHIPADSLLELLGQKGILPVFTYEAAEYYFPDTQVIVNTTPIGMFPKLKDHVGNLEAYPDLEAVVDAIYNPLNTELVLLAKEKGLKASGGLYMLVAQAVAARNIFLNLPKEKADRDLMEITRRIYLELAQEKENIVVSGMPASGKSTVSRVLSEQTGRRILELDAILEKKAGKKISEIFAEYGEKYFRDLESQVVEEVSSETGVIISTGGGCILREENVRSLKQNGRIFFLDRPLEALMPTADRPLSSDREAIAKRYEERYEKYLHTADVVISNPQSPKAAAREIVERRRDFE